MRAISLWQPWASLLASGHKIHETRSWPPPPKMIGKRFAIHAAKRPISLLDWDCLELNDLCVEVFGSDFVRTLPRGGFVGTAALKSYKRMVTGTPFEASSQDDFIAGDWTPGRFAWEFANHRAFKAIVPARGYQRIWSIEDEILAAA